jgi:hypothetical protein
VAGLCLDSHKAGEVSLEDINHPATSQKFMQKRAKYSGSQKLLIDEMEFSRAMVLAYDGLYHLAIACETVGLVKPLPYPEVEQCVYHARFKYIKEIPVPRYVPYEEFVEQRAADKSSETATADSLARAKQQLIASKNHLA